MSDNSTISNPTQFLYVSKRTGISQIYYHNNGEDQQLTFTGNNRRPKLSPDGRTVLFESDRDGNYQLYTIDIAGTNLYNFSNNKFEEGVGSWSPSGKAIAYYSNKSGKNEIYIRNLVTGLEKKISDNDYENWRPTFSNSGDYLVYGAEVNNDQEDLFLYNFSTKKTTRLTNEKKRDGWASFNPKDTKILFHSERTGRSEIWEMNIDGSNPKQLTRFPNNGFKPVYVVEGNVEIGIMYASERDNHNDWDIIYLYFDTYQPRKLIDSSSRDYEPFFIATAYSNW